MPHFSFEYMPEPGTAPDVRRMLDIGLEAGVGCGFMNRADIKLRAYRPEAVLLGSGETSFIHVTVSMLAGRSGAQKLALAKALTEALRAAFPEISAISADMRDMDPETYKKSLR